MLKAGNNLPEGSGGMMYLYGPFFCSAAIGAIRDIFQAQKRYILFHGHHREGISFHVEHIVIGSNVSCLEVVAGAADTGRKAVQLNAVFQYRFQIGERRFIFAVTEAGNVHVALNKTATAYHFAPFERAAAGGAQVYDQAGSFFLYFLRQVKSCIHLSDTCDKDIIIVEFFRCFGAEGKNKKRSLVQQAGDVLWLCRRSMDHMRSTVVLVILSCRKVTLKCGSGAAFWRCGYLWDTGFLHYFYYFRNTMDPLQQFNDTLGQWVAFLDDYSLEMLCRPTKAAAWSLGQVYRHIIDDTGWYAEQVATALESKNHHHEQATREGRQILAEGFPDVQIAGPATGTFIPQPESIDQLRQGLLAIQQAISETCGTADIDAATGKTQHPGLGYFTAAEWLRFATVHMQHHLRQKKRIDAQLFAGNTVNKSLFIQAPAATVWEMLTDPEKINLWMMDTPVHIQSDWKVGSPLVFTGDLHGLAFENKGIILAFEPEQLLAYTHWSSLSERPDEPEQYGVITFRLTAAEAGTMLDFTQTNTGKYATDRHVNYYWGTALALIKKRCEATV